MRFDFLDFSTVDLREQACRDELRLNRRMAPDVYLEVSPITVDSKGSLHLGGVGNVVDWVVKMRRLPEDRRLDRVIGAGELSETELRTLCQRLARFYRDAPPLTAQPDEVLSQIRQHVRANRQTLLSVGNGLSPLAVLRVHAAQLELLTLHPHWIADRVCDGRMLEGHGDLRPEHVYLVSPPVAIDCIEFNREFRELDMADELAFFAMECDALGAGAVGQAALDACLQATGDEVSPRVVRFYKQYRACVRAKVALLRAEQIGGAAQQEARRAAETYLTLADSYRTDDDRPRIVVVGGAMGVGKSTLATELAAELGWETLNTDALRPEIFGPGGGAESLNEGRYALENRQRVYARMFDRARKLLADGLSVVLDGSFLHVEQCAAARRLAVAARSPILFVRCECPVELAAERVAARVAAGNSVSDARPELVWRQPKAPDPRVDEFDWLTVDTTSGVREQTRQVYARLAE